MGEDRTISANQTVRRAIETGRVSVIEGGLPFTKPVAPFWPLGLITVRVSGDPVALTENVGRDGQGPLKMPRRIRQLIVSPCPLNTRPIYIVMPGYSYWMSNGVILVISPGIVGAIPVGCLLEGSACNIDMLYMDAEIDGEGAYATAIWG